MRDINKIIVHCSATREGQDITIDDIRRWHVEDNKWIDVGYHYVIHLDGSINKGRAESTVGAHVKGHNANSIGVCYIGGLERDGKTAKDTRTHEQKVSLIKLLRELKSKYPKSTIHGHNEFANKACPSFNAYEEYKNLSLDKPMKPIPPSQNPPRTTRDGVDLSPFLIVVGILLLAAVGYILWAS